MNHSAMNKSASTTFEAQPEEANSNVVADVKPKKSKIPLLVFRTSPMDISSIKSMDVSGRKSVSSIESNGRPSRIPILVKETSRKGGLERREISPAKVSNQRSSNKKSHIPVAVNEKENPNNSETESTKDDLKSKTSSEALTRKGITAETTSKYRDIILMEDIGYTGKSRNGKKDVISIEEIEIYSSHVNNSVNGNVFNREEKMERKSSRSKIPIFIAIKTPRTEAEKTMLKKRNGNETETADHEAKRNIKSAKKSRIPISTNRQMAMRPNYALMKNGVGLESDCDAQDDVLPRSGLRKRLGRVWKSIKRIFTCKCCRESEEE